MVHVIFYNLLRSKYGVHEMKLATGSIHDLIDQIIDKDARIERRDLESAVVFYRGHPIHFHAFDRLIDDETEIIFTHFVGGG